MKLTKFIGALALLSATSAAQAYTFNHASLQSIFDDITVSSPGCTTSTCTSSFDVSEDFLSSDEVWAITGAGGSIATMIVELSSTPSSNSLGIYDMYDSSRRAVLFGNDNDAGDQVTLRILEDGRVIVSVFDPDTYSISGGYTGIDFTSNQFGYYLENEDTGAIWYSDSDLNEDKEDHLLTYQGNDEDVIQVPGYSAGTFTDNEFILAWEDSAVNPNSDYDDFVIIVESVLPISEPLSLGLLGLGLLGLGVTARRRRK